MASTNGTSKTQGFPPTGISILIVGAGVAGIMAAIDCHRQGHTVRIVERAESRLVSGDNFSIGYSALRGLNHWPEMVAENEKIATHPWIAWGALTGERRTEPAPFPFAPGPDGKAMPLYRHSRPKFHQMLINQLERDGMSIDYGCRATEYIDASEGSKPAVILADGRRLEADLVVAADGVGSHSNRLTRGELANAVYSGSSIYRASLPLETALADEEIRTRFKKMDDGRPIVEMWTGEGMHAGFEQTDTDMIWHITYTANQSEGSESWSRLVEPEDVLKVTATVEGWPAVADKLIRLTPGDRIYDFKLMWREAQPCWTSPSGLIVQIGDAAHTFLPSSGNGATQGLEDAMSLATCLRLGGKDDIAGATRVHNKLRFERVSCFQMAGIINHAVREHGAKQDIKRIAKPLGLTGAWSWQHDPERYAIDNFTKAKEDAGFKNTNIPPGYVYKPWSIDGLMAQVRSDELHLDGEWD